MQTVHRGPLCGCFPTDASVAAFAEGIVLSGSACLEGRAGEASMALL